MTLALATILLLLLLANCATAQGGRIIERTTDAVRADQRARAAG